MLPTEFDNRPTTLVGLLTPPVGEIPPELAAPGDHYAIIRCKHHGLHPWMTRTREFVCCETVLRIHRETSTWLH